MLINSDGKEALRLEMIRRLRFTVNAVTPEKAVIIVLSNGDDWMLAYDNRIGWHFPQGEAGVYAGSYPGTDEEAIAHLEALRANGGQYLLFPQTSFWWLEHYKRFSRHLEANYQQVYSDSRTCVVFALERSANTSPSLRTITGPKQQTIDFVRTTSSRVIAEIGIFRGYTSFALAEILNNQGELHLFDFEDRVTEVAARLRAAGFTNVVAHGNSIKQRDSYNWSLMRLLETHRGPIFDYVFLDGAHTWDYDALAFLLVDRLLKVGGHVDFDDYSWSLKRSPTMNPEVNATTAQRYTQAQIEEQHVRLIVELLVRSDTRYQEVVKNRIFRKTGAALANRSPLERTRGIIAAAVPLHARVAVISKGDDDLVNLDGPIGWHFPQTRDGIYAGHHPGDSNEAIRHLEDLRARGADYLVIPSTSFWWLDYYAAFRDHLEAHYPVVAFQHDACLILSLRDAGASVDRWLSIRRT